MTLDVPGAQEDGLDVRPGPSPGTLAIRARIAVVEPQGRPVLKERSRPTDGTHQRIVPVAWDADVNAARPSLSAGVLTIVVPKMTDARAQTSSP